jgi:hypothetical protein
MKLEIPNKYDYTHLLIQGVNKNGDISDLTSKLINEEEKVIQFIEKMDQMEFVEASKKELSVMEKELTIRGNYLFALSNKETMDNKFYVIFFLGDGRLFFQDTNGKQQMRCSSKEKHLDLLNEMKILFNISF